MKCTPEQLRPIFIAAGLKVTADSSLTLDTPLFEIGVGIDYSKTGVLEGTEAELAKDYTKVSPNMAPEELADWLEDSIPTEIPDAQAEAWRTVGDICKTVEEKS